MSGGQLHVIVSPERWLDLGACELAREVALGGADRIHLRAPDLSTSRALELGEELLAGIGGTESCGVVVNDRIDLAAALGIRSIQLPERSFEPPVARALLEEEFGLAPVEVGASRHDAAGVAAAIEAGADWVFLGHIFPTASHRGAPPLDRSGAAASIAAAGTVPIVAIGGVDEGVIDEVLRMGFSGVAVQGAVFGPSEPRRSIGAIREALDRGERTKGRA
ncbi:MAG: hypothetical protein CME06_17025 [Gemmatimonadetes bacterium]|nr:hypothetical protein [Gemmatimonadota bacterium]